MSETQTDRRGCTALRTFDAEGGRRAGLAGLAGSVGADGERQFAAGEHRVSAVGRSARRLAIKLIGAV